MIKRRSPFVSAVRAEYEDLFPVLCRAIELAGGLGLKDGDVIALKLNLCDARTPETGAITHPLFLDMVLRYLRENYEQLEIYVVESDATVVLADEFVRWFGFIPILKKWDAKWMNLSTDKVVKKKINGLYFKEISIPSLLTRAYLISLPKLKTNQLTKITCSLKNQFGCLPEVKKSKFHPKIDEVIADVNLALQPRFSLVDGIIAMGGARGPAFGVPIKANVVLAGKDPIAVDCACAKVIGINPRRVGHIRKAAALGVGSMDYTLVGDKLEKKNFEISKLESFQLRVGGYLGKTVRGRFRQSQGD